jgi:hypothetical protein
MYVQCSSSFFEVKWSEVASATSRGASRWVRREFLKRMGCFNKNTYTVLYCTVLYYTSSLDSILYLARPALISFHVPTDGYGTVQYLQRAKVATPYTTVQYVCHEQNHNQQQASHLRASAPALALALALATHNTTLHGTVRYSTVQYSTVQYSIDQWMIWYMGNNDHHDHVINDDDDDDDDTIRYSRITT